MSKKRSPSECPTCEQIPCRCAGGGADEKKPEKDNKSDLESKRNESLVNNTVNNAFILNLAQMVSDGEEVHTTLLNPKNQLFYCTIFASAANQPTPISSNNLQEDNASNAVNTSSTVMKMGGGMDE